MLKGLIGGAVTALVLVACGEGRVQQPQQAAPSPVEVASPDAEPTPAPREPDGWVPEPGEANARCVNGWNRPLREDPIVREGLRILRRHMGVEGGFSLQDFRFFEGPESPPSEKGYALVVRRWYFKGHLKKDPSVRGRWLVEERDFGSGIAAMAPYDTKGFKSPDWIGIEYRERMEPRSFEGIPGEWRGEPYDYVKPGFFGFPGLPDEVRGCMRGS